MHLTRTIICGIIVYMYIEKIPNRNSPPCALIRESFREDGKVRKRTLANISHLPDELVQQIGKLLKGGNVIENFDDNFRIIRSLPYANVKAALSTLKQIGLDKVISSSPQNKNHKLVTAMIIARIINPCSKLATVRSLNQETCSSVLSDLLNMPDVNENDLYHAMDWLLTRQGKIEASLADKHLTNGSLVLYDVSSSYFEGVCCPLAARGHDKDHKKSKLIIVYGLLCNQEGCPVAIEVFKGNTGDPTTVKVQIEKLTSRFGLKRIIIVGDRGMLTSARIREDLKPIDGIDWISALKAPQIRKIMRDNEIEKSLFDKRDIAEITHPDFPDERLMVCYNPLLETKREKTRQSLLAATEKDLQKIVKATLRKQKPLRTVKEIGIAVGKVINKHKVGKHFNIEIEKGLLAFHRKQESIDAEAKLDGIYIIRTSVSQEHLTAAETVMSYKQLSAVEQAFRSMKTVDLKIRPINHYLADRVRSHVLLCMLAYYVEWHMRQQLAPMLFDDDDKQTSEQLRSSPVRDAQPSPGARRKAATKKCREDGLVVHSFQTLLDDLATVTRNTIELAGQQFEKITTPTPTQQKALNLMKVRL
ncbi:MAG: IS1634 family transposase [FCB group bacterium]|nr:IS1634 family transposase [FCB group bacterium]